MIGNFLFGDFFNGLFNLKNVEKISVWDGLSEDKQSWYKSIVAEFNDLDDGEDIQKRISGFTSMHESAQAYFTTIEKGQATENDLIQTMSQTYIEVERTGSVFDRVKEKVTKFGISIKNTLKDVGRSLLGGLANAGINLLVNAGISLLFTAIDNWIHAEEKAIEAGEKAFENINASIDTYNSKVSDIKSLSKQFADDSSAINTTGDAIESLSEKYTKLKRGVGADNSNISLTSDEYEEYISLSNQLADLFPEIKSGTDSQGNSLLNLSTSASSAAEQLQKLIDVQATLANAKILDNMQDAFTGVGTEVKQLKEEEAKLVEQRDNLVRQAQTSYSDGHLYVQGIMPEDGDSILQAIASATRQNKDEISYVFSPNGENGYDFNFNVGMDLDEETLKEVSSQIDAALYGIQSKIQTNLVEIDSQITANQLQQSEKWKSFANNVAAPYIQTSSQLKGISESIKNAISQNLTEIDWGAQWEAGTDPYQFLLDEFIIPIRELTPEAQEAMEKLLTIDPSKLSINEYKREIAKQLNTISDDVKVQEDWATKLGLDKAIKEVDNQGEVLKNKFWTHLTEINRMTGEERQIAYDLIVNDGFSGTFDELQNRIRQAKTEIDLDVTPLYDEIGKAFESKNAGDIYKDMVSKLKTAKELYDKGEIGTDDFKSVAKWLSPTGADDAMNFQENWGKAKRYFTEDSAKGVQNFLKDLKSKGLAESTKDIDANGNAIEKWTYKIEDLEEAAQKMGIGFEPMMAIFNRLNDYGASNNFVGSLDQGKDRIAEKTKELAEAEAHLAELEREGIQKNGKYGNQTAIDAQKDKIERLKQDIIETTDCMKQLAARSAETYKAQAEGAKEAIAVLQEEREKILADESMDKATRESIAAMMQDQIDAWAQEYHIELEGSVKMDEASIEPVELTLYLSDKDIEEATKAAEKLKELGSEEFNFDFTADANNIEKELSKADRMLNQFRGKDGKINLSLEGAEEAQTVMSTLIARKLELEQPTIMYVDTSQMEDSVATVIGKLQEYQAARNEWSAAIQMKNAGFDIDITAAEGKLHDLLTQIQALQQENPQLFLSLNLDTSSIMNLNASIDEVDSTKLVEAEVIGKDQVDKLNASIKNTKEKTVQVKAQVLGATAVERLGAAIRSLQDKKVYVTTVKKETTEADGTVHARANGSAISAYARGSKISLPRDEVALINELGPESIVRDGKWQLIEGGAHFEKLHRGDIIFNHKQTEELLKHGYVTSGGGRGVMAHAKGTAINAYAGTGAGGVTFGYGGSGSKSSSSSSSKKSTDKNTKAVNKNTAAQNANTNAIQERKDFLEIKLERISHQLDEYKNLAENYYSALSAQNKMLDAAINQSKSNIKANEQAYSTYMMKANEVGLSEDYKNRIINGEVNIHDITDENLKKQIDDFTEFYEKAQACRDAIIDLKTQIIELSKQKIDSILDDYDSFLAMSDSIYGRFEAENKLFEAMGKSASEYNLQMMLNQRNNQVMYSRGELEDLVNLNNSLLQSGDIKMWSQEWYELQAQIHDVYTQIYEAETAVYELRQQLREVRWEPFRKAIEQIDAVNDNLENTLSLISDLEAFGKDSDTLNMNGKLQLGLLTKQLGNARQAVAEYENAFKALDNELANGNITQGQYDEQLKELNEGRWEAVSSVKKYRDAILDLVKDGINKETEAMQKLVDTRKKDLQAQKDAANYARTLRDKTTEINKIKAQIASLQGDDRASTKAQLRNLQNQLKEKEQDLQDTQDDHAFDVLQDGYDNAMEKFEEIQENELYLLNSSLEAQNEAIANMLMVARDNYKEVYDELNEIAEVYGMKLSSDIVNPWTTAMEAVNAYRQAVGDLSAKQQIDTSSINGVTGNTDYVRYEENNTSAPDNNVTQQQSQQQSSMLGYVSDISETLQYGSQGDNVRKLQNVLNALGYNAGSVDGSFGNQTLAAVKRFQSAAGIAVDGVVGKNTKAAFRARGYAKGSPSTQKGWAYYDEEGLGSEFIITEDGLMKKFNTGDTVFNPEQTKYLYEISKLAAKHNLPNVQLPLYNPELLQKDMGTYIEKLVEVQGNITEDVFPRVELAINTALKNFEIKQRRDISNNYRKSGGRLF